MKRGIKSILMQDPEIAALLARRSASEMAPFMEGLRVLFKGKDGYTPVKGKDYFTKEEVALFLEKVTPIKGKDYFSAKEVNDMMERIAHAVLSYVSDNLKEELSPKKDVDYFDGQDADVENVIKIITEKIPTKEQVAALIKIEKAEDGKDAELSGEAIVEAISNLSGADKEAFGKKLGSMIDISQIRNAQSFMFNGKRYKFEELMHGGGGSSTTAGASVTTQYLLTAVQDGDDVTIDLTQLTNWATFDQLICVYRNNFPQTETLNFTLSGSVITIFNADAGEVYNITYSYSS